MYATTKIIKPSQQNQRKRRLLSLEIRKKKSPAIFAWQTKREYFFKFIFLALGMLAWTTFIRKNSVRAHACSGVLSYLEAFPTYLSECVLKEEINLWWIKKLSRKQCHESDSLSNKFGSFLKILNNFFKVIILKEQKKWEMIFVACLQNLYKDF